MPATSTDRPIRIAAILLATYGIAVVANAMYWQTSAGWQDAPDFGRAVIRFLGMGLVAWGLLNAKRWAWWFAVILPSFWLIAGVGGLLLFFAAGLDVPATVPAPTAWFLAASCIVLGTTVGILLRRDVRNHFKTSV